MPATVLARRYRLDRCIARGAMGEVWRAEDLLLWRPVAIKLLRRYYAGDPVAIARFEAEARCAARLCHHGIAKIYDYCSSRRPFLVMELVDGPSLAVVLTRGPLRPWRALDVVTQAASALDASHSAGIIHCDVKPANLLLAPGGQVKLTDFGIAHSPMSVPQTNAGAQAGTPAYLAPELIAGRPATPASDLYSLGVVMYECLTGARPFTGTTLEVAMAHHGRPLPTLPPLVPDAVRALLAHMTAKDPQARLNSAAAVASRAAALREDLASGNTAQAGSARILAGS